MLYHLKRWFAKLTTTENKLNAFLIFSRSAYTLPIVS